METRGEKGFSLLEVMFASAIVGVMCVAVLGLMLQIDASNRFIYDRTICYRAAHQAMEILMAEDLDSMLLQDGNSFVVTECRAGPQQGTITVTDLNWGPAGDVADKAYSVQLDVPSFGVMLTAVRTRT